MNYFNSNDYLSRPKKRNLHGFSVFKNFKGEYH